MSTRSLLLRLIAGSALLAPAAGGSPAGAGDVGLVLDLRGQWLLEGPPAAGLRIGQALPAGGRLRNLDPIGSDFITVLLYDGQRTLSRSCRKTPDCAAPIVLPGAAVEDPVWTRALRALGALFPHQTETLVPTLSREVLLADETVQAREAVIPLTAEGLDLAALLAGSAPGAYRVTFEPIGHAPGRPAASPAHAAQVELRAGAQPVARLPGLAPGL